MATNLKHLRELQLFDTWDELGENFSSKCRTIYLEGTIELQTISFINQRVALINEITKDEATPITLEITSQGGDVFGLFGIVDTMQALKTPIRVVGRGAVFSAAAVILAAATGERAVYKNTFVMFHQPSLLGDFSGTTDEFQIAAENIKDIYARINAILGEVTKKPVKFWRDSCKKDFYITPEQCLEYGVIDLIL